MMKKERKEKKKKWKKITCCLMNFAFLTVHRVKIEENKIKYLDLARELKRLKNIMVTVITVVIGILGTVLKGLKKGLEELEIRGRIEAVQTAALFRTDRIFRRFRETGKDLLSLRLPLRIINCRWCEQLAKTEMIIIQRDIFQGDSLSLQSFVIIMMPLGNAQFN